MNVAKCVEVLELTMKIMGFDTLIYPTLIWDENTVIMVDAGLPTSLQEIEKLMTQVGVPSSNIDMVFLTHQDLDHIGCLPEL